MRNLTTKQLEKLLNSAQSELERRSLIGKANKEIQSILKKYNVSLVELDQGKGLKKNSTSKRSTEETSQKQGDKRGKVAAKYADPSSNKKWSGRGRAPGWVNQICLDENISLSDFKDEPRFKIR